MAVAWAYFLLYNFVVAFFVAGVVEEVSACVYSLFVWIPGTGLVDCIWPSTAAGPPAHPI